MLTKIDLKSIALLLKVQKEEILDEVDKRFANFDKKIDSKLKAQAEEIIRGVGEFIQDNLIALFDDHDARLTKLEKKVFPSN